jgi:hypothetical protein
MKMSDESKNAEEPGVPLKEDIERVFAIVTRATTSKRPELPTSRLEQRLRRSEQWFFSHAVHAAVVMIAAALLALYLKSQSWIHTMQALSIISLVLVLAMFVVGIVSGSLFFLNLRKSAYGPFLGLVRLSAMHDFVHVQELVSCRKEALQYVHVHYKQERNGYERRSGMLGGSIEKIGFFPALAGLVLLVFNLLKVPGAIAWGSFFGPLLLAFYFMSIASSQMVSRMDRVIALLDFVIQSKK